MVDVNVDFILGQEEPIEAEFVFEPDVVWNADLELTSPVRKHDQLENRDLPNQHPIDAITDLREILNNLWTSAFEQEIPEDTWVIEHNLGRFPSVTVIDTAGSMQIPDEVIYDSEDKMTVKFISSFAGKAYLN